MNFPGRVLLTERGLLRAALVVFALFLAYRFLATVVAAVLLISAGLLLAVALSGPVEALYQRKVPRPAGTALIVGGALAVIAAGGYLLLPELARQASQLVTTLPEALSQALARLRELANSLGLQIGGGDGITTSTLASVGRKVLGGALGLFTNLASFLLGLVVILFVPLYLVAKPEPVVRWVVRLFPPGRRERAREVLATAYTSLLGWLKGRLASMAIVGVLSIAALYIIGIPGALFLGVLTGLLAFVPFIGPVVSVVPPFLLGLAGDPVDALWVLLAYAGIQQVESNLVTPLIMQQVASLHPAVVIVSVTVLGSAFGILGTLLAVPAAVVAGVLVDELWFERLEAADSS
ncbi:MAG: AI-2E family transporter [Rubrobacter sp.]|nr:AI-2E family transporter [Rubrobacter sp.]